MTSVLDAMDDLVRTLLAGDHGGAVAATDSLLAGGATPRAIVTGGLQRAMDLLDEKCTLEAFNLLEIMLVGRAVSAVVARLFPQGGDLAAPARGRFVIATLEGDVHDLGKNIVRTVLMGRGWSVVDAGKDCPVVTLVTAAEREGADAVLISGLITSVVPRVREVRAELAKRGLIRLPIIAGGAALRQSSPEDLNVDYVAQDAFDGARHLERLFGHRPAEARP